MTSKSATKRTSSSYNGTSIENNNATDENWFQILAVVIAGISAISNGIFFSWPSPFILKISQDKINYDISEEEASKFSVYPFIVVVICCPIFSRLSDVFGRKRILLLTSFVDLVIWILKAVGRSIYVLYLARCLVGVTDSMMFSSLPAYLGEVASPKIRGTWGNSMTVGFLLGGFLVTVVGSYCNVQETSYIFMPIPVIFFVLFAFMPESPYFYVMKGRFDEAKQSLRSLNRRDEPGDFLALKADVDRQMSEMGSWKDMFMIDSNRRALTAMVFLKVSQTLGGAKAFSIFTQYIFDQSKGSFSTETSSIIYIGLNASLSLCGCFTVQWLGRKKSYIGSVIPCCIVLFLQAIYFLISQDRRPDSATSYFKWIPIAGMVLHSVFSSYGLSIMPTLMLGELFSTSFRSRAVGILMFLNGIVSFIANLIFYALSSNFGLHAPFFFFASCNLVSSVLAFYILPETKNKTLEEIQQSMKDRKSKPEDERKTLIGVKTMVNSPPDRN